MVSTNEVTDGESVTVSIRKRAFLSAAAGVAVTGIAGCLGDPADEGADENDGSGTGDGEESAGDGNDPDGNPDLPPIEQPESYVMEERFTSDAAGDDTPPSVFEVHGDDLVFYQEGRKDEIASYIVDGTLYSVMGGQCTKMDENESEESLDRDAPTYDPPASYSFERVGTETVDGVSLEVYRREGTEDFRIYIDPETNYVHRLESGGDGVTSVFHSFGEVDPIEPPDMDCTDVSGGDETSE